MGEDTIRKTFAVANRGSFWESLDEIHEPHGFDIVLTLGTAPTITPTRPGS